MPVVTIALGVILTLLGLWGYFGLGSPSITALIPAFFGIPFLVLGIVARNERYLKHAMHGAAALAVLAFLGTVPGLVKAFAMLRGAAVQRPTAVTVQAIVAILSLVFVVLCIVSFVQARRSRAAA